LSGVITGAVRDVAWRGMMKGYMKWKHRLCKENEAKIKQKQKTVEGGK